MIQVTKSFLPEMTEYLAQIEKIWSSGQLTNDGPLVVELEKKIANFLEVNHFLYVNNGTIALQLAIKALNLQGDVITTPFSYCATTHALIWEKCNPIFADISPVSLTCEAADIQKVFTQQTKGILTTHVYGNSGNLAEIDNFSIAHNIPVVYDGAHAFGVKHKGQSIFNYGTISTCSFHATKIFHTIEGGAVITNDSQLAEKLKGIRSFGHRGDHYFDVGINAKNSEFHAAMGLVNLSHFPEIVKHRKEACHLYESVLSDKLSLINWNENNTRNYSYFPVIFPSEELMLHVITRLNQEQIYPRRYFYPALNELPYLEYQSCPVAEDIAKRIACLPLSADIDLNDVKSIANIINQAL